MRPNQTKPQKTLLLRTILSALTAATATSALAAPNYLIDTNVLDPNAWSQQQVKVENTANIINRDGAWTISEMEGALELGSGLYIGYDDTGLFAITASSDGSTGYFSVEAGHLDTELPTLIPFIDPSIRIGDAGGSGTLNVVFDQLSDDALSEGQIYSSRLASFMTGVGVGLGAGSRGQLNVLGTGKTQDQVSHRSPNHFMIYYSEENSLIGSEGGEGSLELNGAALTITVADNYDSLNYFVVGDKNGSVGSVDILGSGKLAIGNPTYGGPPERLDLLPGSVIGKDGGEGRITIAPSSSMFHNQANFSHGMAVGQGGGIGTLDVLQGGKSVINTGAMIDLGSSDMECLANNYPLAPAALLISADGTSSGLVRTSGTGAELLVAGQTPYAYTDGSEPFFMVQEALGEIQIGTGGTLVSAEGGNIQVGVSRMIFEQTLDNIMYKRISVGGLGPITVNGTGTVVYGSETLTPVPAGTIEASLINLQNPSAQLSFNHAGSLNFDRPLAGNGKLSQQAGTTTISATLASFPELDPALFAFPTTTDCIPAIASGYPMNQAAFTGSLDVQGGTLVLPATDVLPGLTSTLVSGGTLMMGSTDQNLGNVELPGGVLQLTGGLEPSATNTASAGSWSGGNGVVQLDTELGDDSSASDKLVITGAISGTTALQISNFGGLGAQTTGAGILVVEASQNNGANSFVLAGPVTRGSFQYRLQQTGNNWYLVSSPYIAPPQQATPVPLLSWLGLLGMGSLLAAVSGRSLMGRQRRKTVDT